MYTKLVPIIIQEKLKAKERALSFDVTSKNFGDQDEGAIKAKDIQSRTTFVRMCSNKLNVPNKIIAGGEFKDKYNSENELVSKMLFGKELYEKKKNGQIRPISGLKSIEVSYKGSFKAIREATVNWVVPSIDDLEELTPYFLTVGKTIALDWGWVNSNVSRVKMFNGVDPFITYDPLFNEWNVNQDIFSDPQYKIQTAGGDYDAIAGKVSNFEMTLRQDGGFDCVTKVTAIGAALFQKPIDKPANQVQIESKKGNDSVKTAYDSDNIINAIINLKGIILSNTFGVTNPVDTKSKYFLTSKVNLRPEPSSPIPDSQVILQKEYYGIAVDNKNNPNVLWMVRSGIEDVFVKWGWMEDQILNRYISLKGGKDNDIKMTIRSIDTALNPDTNLPILLTKGKAEEIGKGSEEWNNSGYDPKTNLYSNNDGSAGDTNQYIVKGGDSLSKIADNLKVDLDELVQTNIVTLVNVQSDEYFQGLYFSDNGIPDDHYDNQKGVIFEEEYIPRANYGMLNLQPGQRLNYTPPKVVSNPKNKESKEEVT